MPKFIVHCKFDGDALHNVEADTIEAAIAETVEELTDLDHLVIYRVDDENGKELVYEEGDCLSCPDVLARQLKVEKEN